MWVQEWASPVRYGNEGERENEETGFGFKYGLCKLEIATKKTGKWRERVWVQVWASPVRVGHKREGENGKKGSGFKYARRSEKVCVFAGI